MREAERLEFGHFSAFLAGALVGAGVALLCAPQTGSRTRRMLRVYGTKAKDELEGAMERGSDAWDRAVESGQDVIQKGKESVRDVARQAKQYAKSYTEAAKEGVEHVVEQIVGDRSSRRH